MNKGYSCLFAILERVFYFFESFTELGIDGVKNGGGGGLNGSFIFNKVRVKMH
jgi:hypothetical protein